MKNGPAMVAWCVTEKNGKSFWTRIGAAFRHKSSEGLNVELDALPIGGKLVLLPPKEENQVPQE